VLWPAFETVETGCEVLWGAIPKVGFEKKRTFPEPSTRGLIEKGGGLGGLRGLFCANDEGSRLLVESARKGLPRTSRNAERKLAFARGAGFANVRKSVVAVRRDIRTPVTEEGKNLKRREVWNVSP